MKEVLLFGRWVTAWQYDLGQWSVFHDLQIVGGEIEMNLDASSGWVRVKPTFLGIALEQHLATADVPELPDLERLTPSTGWTRAGITASPATGRT